MSKKRVQPSATCVPCHKEIICSQKAAALIRTGHELMLAGAWTEGELTAWNQRLDDFILDAEAALAAGPMAASGRSSGAGGGNDAELLDSPADV